MKIFMEMYNIIDGYAILNDRIQDFMTAKTNMEMADARLKTHIDVFLVARDEYQSDTTDINAGFLELSIREALRARREYDICVEKFNNIIEECCVFAFFDDDED